MQMVDWNSWLLFLSKKGFFYVEVITQDHRFYHFKVTKEEIATSWSRESLIAHIAEKYPKSPSSSLHTKDVTPLLVLHEAELLFLLPATA